MGVRQQYPGVILVEGVLQVHALRNTLQHNGIPGIPLSPCRAVPSRVCLPFMVPHHIFQPREVSRWHSLRIFPLLLRLAC
jgi:hypothetical protein